MAAAAAIAGADAATADAMLRRLAQIDHGHAAGTRGHGAAFAGRGHGVDPGDRRRGNRGRRARCRASRQGLLAVREPALARRIQAVLKLPAGSENRQAGRGPLRAAIASWPADRMQRRGRVREALPGVPRRAGPRAARWPRPVGRRQPAERVAAGRPVRPQPASDARLYFLYARHAAGPDRSRACWRPKPQPASPCGGPKGRKTSCCVRRSKSPAQQRQIADARGSRADPFERQNVADLLAFLAEPDGRLFAAWGSKPPGRLLAHDLSVLARVACGVVAIVAAVRQDKFTKLIQNRPPGSGTGSYPWLHIFEVVCIRRLATGRFAT